jgi:hypothetical protein
MMVGVLNFKDPRIQSFPAEGRKDRELESVLLTEGVPKENLIFLEDQKATGEAMRQGLASMVAKSQPGDTFLFYYAGHGYAEGGHVFLAPYDLDDSNPFKTGFDAIELETILSKQFEGSQVILLGDFCNSGVLGEVAYQIGEKKHSVKAASITSADRWTSSTGSWAYTLTMIRLFQGDSLFDLNGDGMLSFAEGEMRVHTTMRFLESQLSGKGWSSNFNPSQMCSRVKENPKRRVLDGFGIGDFVEIRDRGVWLRGEITDIMDSVFTVVLTNENRELKVASNALRSPLPLVSYPVGSEIEVEWNTQWIEATVKEAHLDFHKVHYAEPLQDWDEWVPPQRMRLPQAISE